MPESTQPTSPETTEAAQLPSLSIAALDDDADFREFLRSQLEHDGHDVQTFATPEDLYASIEQRTPDVLLLDMKMGRASGEDVLVEVRKRWPKLCVIVVTGYPSMDSMRTTFKRDVFDYIPKPFSAAELRRSLSQAVASLGLGQRPQDRLRAELGRGCQRRSDRQTIRPRGQGAGVAGEIESGTRVRAGEGLHTGHIRSRWPVDRAGRGGYPR